MQFEPTSANRDARLRIQQRLGDELAAYLNLSELRAYTFLLGRGHVDRAHGWRASARAELAGALAISVNSTYEPMRRLVVAGAVEEWEENGEWCCCLTEGWQPRGTRGKRRGQRGTAEA